MSKRSDIENWIGELEEMEEILDSMDAAAEKYNLEELLAEIRGSILNLTDALEEML